jgi:hypothetical protein
MHACNPTSAPIVKGDKYGSFQSPKNQYEINQIKSVPYALAVKSLMYAQVCTRLDLAFFDWDAWQISKKARYRSLE